MQLNDQFFFHYESLEEYKAGMWRSISGQKKLDAIAKARSFMMDTGRFAEAMARVIAEWDRSCKVSFTNPSTNGVAWLGQAAVTIETGIPESCTRAAWNDLPFDVQVISNANAKRFMISWLAKNLNQFTLDL